ncbi:MAG: LPS-assembly protein LptD [Gammaproteobacteria bacterium]
MRTARLAPAAIALLMLSQPTSAWAEPDSCLQPVSLPDSAESETDKLSVTADRAEVTRDGVSVFTGSVELSQGPNRIEANRLNYDPRSSIVSIEGEARYDDPRMQVEARDLSYNTETEEAKFRDGDFVLPERPARGSADEIRIKADGRVKLEDVVYTTCMDEDPDWEFSAEKLELDTEASRGTARGVKLDFLGVPIAYLPYISFPLNKDRKSGLLFPEFRNSDSSGTEVRIPYYWNIAPNYDATITPRIMSKRGVQWMSEFRYLRPTGTGQLDVEYLYDDNETDSNRRLTHWQHVGRYREGWRFSTDITEVSDDAYFEDLGTSASATSQTHLLRNAEIEYLAENWQVVLRGRNYQTIDQEITPDQKPYERLPQLLFNGSVGTGLGGVRFDWASELVNFSRDSGVEGIRASVEPALRLPIEGPGYFMVPRISWRGTQYKLDSTAPGQDDNPSFDAPILSLDGGLLFERTAGDGRYLQTIEPRVLYAYIPDRNQDDIPVFDTGLPDFNTVQLFRPNRFVGGDRLGDTDQISVGITSRLLRENTGREFLTATLGQVFYLSNRRVELPGQPVNYNNESNMVLELGLDIFKNWNADLGYQWDVGDNSTQLAEVRLQYRPAENKVANISYRYRPDILEQAEVSLGWPLSRNWSAVGQLEYSLREDASIERLVGLQYESCCWAARLASQRNISNRDGSRDTSVLFQIEFKGLAGVGSGARERFESDILGYSVYE